MALEPIDEEFLRVNAELRLITPERIASAQKIQELERASGARARSLIDVLRVQGVIDKETEARFRAHLAAGILKPEPAAPADPAEPPTEGILGGSDTLLDLGTPLGDSQPTALRPRKALFCPRCAARMNVAVVPDITCYRCGTCRTELVEPPAAVPTPGDETRIIKALDEQVPTDVEAAMSNPANRFGKYFIVSEIGHGGIGIVHKAWDTYFSQYVALKRAKTVPADKGIDQDVYVESLIKEARSLVLLRHPNIVAVYDIGRIEGQFYLSMEYVEGRTLFLDFREARQIGHVSPYFADPVRYIGYLRDIARALHYAHTLPTPVVHCDLKPSNVLIDRSDRPVLLDFGLAHKMRSLRKEPSGVASGTPSYMAPEQAAGRAEDIDARTDVYGLGAILYELLTGRPPFVGSLQELLRKTILDQPDRPSDVVQSSLAGAMPAAMSGKGVLTALEDLCLKCLEKDRARRWQTAGELADALEKILKDHRPKAGATPALMAPAAALTALEGGRKALACRGAYVYLRHAMREPAEAAALAGACFQWAASGQNLRESTLKAAANLTPEGAEGARPAEDAAAIEPLLSFFDPDPVVAYGQAWAAETVRFALGVFHQECEKSGRRELYEELHRRCGFGTVGNVTGRLERRARRRLRELFRRIVGDTLKSAGRAEDELKALRDLLPEGASVCRRCEGAFDPRAIEELYAGFCPSCLLEIAIESAPPLEEIGRYEILGRLGGEVYRARGTEDPQEVALRILPDRKAVEMARVAMRIRHRSAISVIDAGEADGIYFVVEELVEGTPLRELAAKQPFPKDRAIRILTALSEAVERIHEAGLVHGSLDSSKVIVDRSGEPHIGDFGYASPTAEARAADVAALSDIFACCTGNRLATWEGAAAAAPAPQEIAVAGPEATPRRPAKSGPGIAIGIGVAAVVVAAVVGLGAFFLGGKGPKTESAAPKPPGDPHKLARKDLEAALIQAAQRKDLEKGAEAADRYAAAWPLDIQGHWLAAYVAFARCDFKTAEKRARDAIERDQAAGPAWRIVGLVAMERLDYPAARDALGKSMKPYALWDMRTPPWDEADDLLAEGLMAYAGGDIAGGPKFVDRSNQKRPSAEACRWMGFMQRDPAANIRYQTDALLLRPDYAPALIERGIARVAAKEYDAAIGDLDRGLKALPDHARAVLNRGMALAAKGRLEPAHADLTRAVELAPGELGWIERSKVRYRLGSFAGAADDAAEALRLYPMLAECHLEHGRALWKLKKKRQAELDFANAVRLDPRLKGEVEKIRKE